MTESFDVWEFYKGGKYSRVLCCAPMQRAVTTAVELAATEAAEKGVIARIIITDRGDNICYEWIHGKGRTFPPMES